MGHFSNHLQEQSCAPPQQSADTLWRLHFHSSLYVVSCSIFVLIISVRWKSFKKCLQTVVSVYKYTNSYEINFSAAEDLWVLLWGVASRPKHLVYQHTETVHLEFCAILCTSNLPFGFSMCSHPSGTATVLSPRRYEPCFPPEQCRNAELLFSFLSWPSRLSWALSYMCSIKHGCTIINKPYFSLGGKGRTAGRQWKQSCSH